MTGRIYAASAENLTLGTGNVLIALRTATGVNAASILGIKRVEIAQNGTTTSAQIRGAFSTRNTSGTLTTTSVTPANLSVVTGPSSGLSGNTSVIGAAARIGVNSSADSGGTYTDHLHFNFNNLNGFLWVPTPEETILVPPDVVWCVRLLATPGTTSGWTILLIYQELN